MSPVVEQRIIQVSSIISNGSLYRLGRQISHVSSETHRLKAFYSSVKEVGILQPLLTHECSPGEYHLMDGFFRIKLCIKHGIENVPITLFPAGTRPETPLKALIACRHPWLLSSAPARIHFVSLLNKLRIDRRRICEIFLPLLGIEPHEVFLRKYELAARLPEDVLQYCEEKNFSMKQCLQLSAYTEELLSTILSWKSHLAITSSIFEELLSNLAACIRRSGKTLAQTLDKIGADRILSAPSDSIQQKTINIRHAIHRQCFPILTVKNEKMNDIKKSFNLPANASFTWDETLEMKKLSFFVTIKNMPEWKTFIGAAGKDTVDEKVRLLLEEL